MVTRADVVCEARSWIGTPWQHQARLRGVAVDCAGLVVGVAEALGLVEPRSTPTAYPRVPTGELIPLCRSHMVERTRQQMAPGDVLVVSSTGSPQHLGILGDYRHGGLSIIHGSSAAGKVIETRLLFSARMRFAAAFSFAEVQP